MNSRVHPPYKTKYRVTNWPEYDPALVGRGNLTQWITPEAITVWGAKATGRRGAPRKYSDLAIETALTILLFLQLPLHQTEGFLRSIFELMVRRLDVPNHTTFSRRGSALKMILGVLQSKKPMHQTSDSIGLSNPGEGEWAPMKEGSGG